MSDVVETTCSGCMREVTVDLAAGSVTMRVPSNGKRGSLHVPAHDAVSEVTFDDTLAHFECPAEDCDYEDSVYIDPQVREDLT